MYFSIQRDDIKSCFGSTYISTVWIKRYSFLMELINEDLKIWDGTWKEKNYETTSQIMQDIIKDAYGISS